MVKRKHRFLCWCNSGIDVDKVMNKAVRLKQIKEIRMELHKRGYLSIVKFEKEPRSALCYMRNTFREFDAVLAYKDRVLQVLE